MPSQMNGDIHRVGGSQYLRLCFTNSLECNTVLRFPENENSKVFCSTDSPFDSGHRKFYRIKKSTMKYLCYVLFIVPALWAGETYRVVIAESDLSKPAWKAVADELVSKHDGEILSFGSDPVEVLGDSWPIRATRFVAPYETVIRTFVSRYISLHVRSMKTHTPTPFGGF